MNEIEIKVKNDKKILLTFKDENGYSETIARCFRADKINKRQHLIDIIDACQSELGIMYEHDEK